MDSLKIEIYNSKSDVKPECSVNIPLKYIQLNNFQLLRANQGFLIKKPGYNFYSFIKGRTLWKKKENQLMLAV